MAQNSTSLAERLDVDQADQALRKRWINLTDEDLARIRAAAEYLRPKADEIVKKFYDHPFSFQEFQDKVTEVGIPR